MKPAPNSAVTRTLLALAALAGCATLASAQVPSGDELARLGERLRLAKAVRVVTPAGSWIETHFELLAEGVHLAGTAQYGETVLNPPQPSLVPWDHLKALEVRRGDSDRGLLYGAAAGLVLGALVAAVSHDEQADGRKSRVLLYPLMGAACGAGFGSVLGTGIDPWKRVWPEPQ
jgi:hypothetical protein